MPAKHKLVIVITALKDGPIAMSDIQKELSEFTVTLDTYVNTFQEIKCMQTVDETEDKK